MFITFEGLDCSGKSTQVRLLADRISHDDYNVLLLREPGGTEIGESIRRLLLDARIKEMTEATEFLLFSASRSQLVEEVVQPALSAGMVVLCDRFYDSSTAYQGWGRKIALDIVQAVNRCASGGLSPTLTFFLDIPMDEVERRMMKMRSGRDRIESSGREFFERVREGYLSIAQEEGKRFHVVEGQHSIEEIHEHIWSLVQPHLQKHPEKSP